MISHTTTRSIRSRTTGFALAFVALLGLLLSPYCHVFDTHERDAPGALVQTLGDRTDAIASAGIAATLADHDDATSCCAVIAERPTTTNADTLAPAGGSHNIAIVSATFAPRSADTQLRHWHSRRPGSPPISALHARSAPLLS